MWRSRRPTSKRPPAIRLKAISTTQAAARGAGAARRGRAPAARSGPFSSRFPWCGSAHRYRRDLVPSPPRGSPVRFDDVRKGLGRLALIARGKTYGPWMRASQDRRERLDDVARRGDEAGALFQEIVGAGGARIEGTGRHGEDFPSLFAGKPRRDQRA